MKSPVKVDLSSAVVAYRPAAGEERSLLAHEVKPRALFNSYPWRTFRSYDKQRHYSGTYWSSTLGDHVIYESGGPSTDSNRGVRPSRPGLYSMCCVNYDGWPT